MKNIVRILILSVVAWLMLGCISPKSYVDPQFHKAGYNDIKKLVEPHRLKVTIEFQRNGERFPRADAEVRGHVERVLRASGFGVPVSENAVGELHLVVNNIADLDSARSKGFGTGLTFGAVGTMVTDYYEMNASLKLNGKLIKRGKYKHAIHTVIGNKAGPEGLESMSLAAAFGQVVEDFLLNFLLDAQKMSKQSREDIIIGFRELRAIAISM